MIQNNKIAIIIVNWKQYELTKSCLLSLKKINCIGHQIILIDNESNQKELKSIKNQFENIQFIQPNISNWRIGKIQFR